MGSLRTAANRDPRRNSRIVPAMLFLLPGFLGFALFYVLPFFISAGYSLLDKPIGGVFVGLRNYIGLFQNAAYLKGLANTAVYMGLCVPLNIALSLAAAIMVLKLDVRGKALITLVFLIPLVIPSGSIAFFWKSLFAGNGYLNGILSGMNLQPVQWLESASSRPIMVLIFLWKNLGYNMVLFLAGLSSIPKEYYEAARVDGAGALRCFRHVTLVFLMPTFSLVSVMSVINSFKVFKEVFLITGNYPHDSIYMLQHFMNNMFSSLNYPKLTSATSVLVLIIAALIRVLFKVEKKVSI